MACKFYLKNNIGIKFKKKKKPKSLENRTKQENELTISNDRIEHFISANQNDYE